MYSTKAFLISSRERGIVIPMKILLSELRTIIRDVLGEDKGVGSGGKAIQRSIDKIVAAYSSITDEDVTAIEELGIFKMASNLRTSDNMGISGGKIYSMLYDMARVKPLFAVFRTGNFISVGEFESKLIALGGAQEEGDVQSDLVLAAKVLPAFLERVRKTYTALLAKSEAGPDDPLGRIAFANDRKGMPYERNTQIEDRLKNALIDHFEGHKMLDMKSAQMIQDLMAQGLYSHIFAEPTTPVLVRGMSVSPQWLARIIGRKPEMRGSAEVNFEFAPKGGASSWTTSKSVAAGFHEVGSKIDIIMYASVADNPGKFLSAAGGLYSTKFISGRFKKEKESLGLGPIKIFKIEWES